MEETNTLMGQSYRDLPQFSMGGQVEDMVTEIEILKGQDMTGKVVQCQIDKGIPHMITVDLCKETEGTMGLHKIIHHNRIMGQQDKVPCR